MTCIYIYIKGDPGKSSQATSDQDVYLFIQINVYA